MESSIIIAAAAALCLAGILGYSIKKTKVNDSHLDELSGYIKKGAMAYLVRQYKVLAIFLIVMFAVLAFLPSLGIGVAVTFVAGALLSVFAGFGGMRAAVLSNVRTAQAAKSGIADAFRVAFSGGSIMGLLVVGLGALGIGIISLVADDTNLFTGFSLGASSIALFCRVGGGIYTKAADVGADLVGKVEAGIPEDDPRNPAVIADNVGDNVGDVAGMGADLFESYVGCIVSAILLATSAAASKFVIMLVSCGILASVLSVIIIRFVKAKNVQLTLSAGTYIAAAIVLAGAALLSTYIVGSYNYFWSVLSGVVAGLLIGQLTEIYTSASYNTVKEIAKSAQTGHATNILSGMSAGMLSTALPMLVIAVTTVISFMVCGGEASVTEGFFGIVLAAVGMLSTVGVVISVDAYGPIADNAGGIAQMSGQPESVRKITDHLDSVGNTTAAIGKGFSIGSAALTSLALFTTYAQAVQLEIVSILSAKVIAGLFIGGMLPFLFSALTTQSVSKAANKMIEEVRRQFREHPGIMQETEKPDYARCVDISTQAAIREMILPGVIAIASPVLVGILLGKEALAGLLAGATVTGVLLAIFMANTGGAWDNAKKYIEDGNYGGKGSEAHKAAVTGPTRSAPLGILPPRAVYF